MPMWKARCPDRHTCEFKWEGEAATFEEARELAFALHKEQYPKCEIPAYAIKAGVHRVEPV